MVREKNIVITGCIQGIGRETVKVFAKNGANIFACAYKQDEEFTAFCNDLEKEYQIKIYPIYFDLADADSIKIAIKEIQSKKVPIHGLVNIAGINRDALFGMISQKDMEETFQVNVFSQIIFTQYIAKLMIRNKVNGSIVFTSSITAMDGNKGQIVYGASKAALIGAMKTMAIELGENNIRVNVVAPGVIKTPMTDKLEEELIKDKIQKMDIPRIGLPEEVANAYMFLMSDLSSHITGQVMRVDGGM